MLFHVLERVCTIYALVGKIRSRVKLHFFSTMNNFKFWLGNRQHFESNECEILVCAQKCTPLLGML